MNKITDFIVKKYTYVVFLFVKLPFDEKINCERENSTKHKSKNNNNHNKSSGFNPPKKPSKNTNTHKNDAYDLMQDTYDSYNIITRTRVEMKNKSKEEEKTCP